MVTALLDFFKTDLGIGILSLAGAVLLAWAKKRFLPATPSDEWTKWEGYIVTGIKFAEKNIPDTVENKALARTDAALKFVIDAYEKSQGKEPSKELIAQITNAIPIVHNALEAAGTLKKAE